MSEMRRLALLVSLAVAGVMPALAQTHPSHPQAGPHDPAAHMAVDPAVHAAMHAHMLGSWSGTLGSTEANPMALHLGIASNRQGKLTLKMTTDRAMKAGAASDVTIDAQGLHWKQALSDTPCKATAVVQPATDDGPETMKGTIACDHGDVAFVLQRSKG